MTFAWWHVLVAIIPILPNLWGVWHIWSHDFNDDLPKKVTWLMLCVFLPVVGGLLYLLLQAVLVGGQAGGQSVVGQREHLHGQYCGVLRSVHAYGGHGYSRRHLHYAEQGVKPVEHSLDGHSDDGQRRRGGYHARQRGGHARPGDYHLHAAALRSARERLHGVGRAVGREGVHFKRHLQLVEQLAGFLHYGQVACAAHDYAYQWFHIFSFEF